MVVIFLSILFFSVLLLSSLFASLADYRRPPLRRPPLPPGPKGWPLVGNLLQLGTKVHQILQDLSNSHGSAGLLRLRLGTVDVIVISSASAAAKCFRSHDAKLSSRPPNSMGRHFTYNFEDLVMAPYGPRWRMLRKICGTHLFSTKALDSFQHVREEELAMLVRDLASKRDAAVIDVGAAVNTCATNALARVLVGRRVIAGGEEAAKFKEMAAEISRLAGEFNVGDFVPGIDWLDLQGLNKKMIKVRERFGEFFEKIIDEHRSNGFNHAKDFLSVLIDMNDSAKEELTDINIKALLQDMFIAGTETISITVEWILAELIRHPNILARAQHELDSIVGRNRFISESDLSNFPFLHAIVKETFRLHPPLPLSLPRMTTEDFEIDGYLIPKGVTVLINVWAIGRDPAAWLDDPWGFNPDRFDSSSLHANVDAKGNDFELIPFGVGRRMCAGINLGLRMVHLTTAMLLHSFDWTLPDGHMAEMLDMEESYGGTMPKLKPLMAKAMPRLAPNTYL